MLLLLALLSLVLLLVRGGREDPPSVTTPIYQTTTYRFDSALEAERYLAHPEGRWLYSRLENPTVIAAEKKLAPIPKDLMDRRVEITAASGGTRVLDTTLNPIVGASGEAIGHVLTWRDVTATKAYEDRLRGELETRRAAVRTLQGALKDILPPS